jgi:hypothetical protein
VIRDRRIVEIQSFSTPGVRYEVDLEKRSCRCPAFQSNPRRECKHLRSLDELFEHSGEPDPTEALSALVKSIRLRRSGDAVTWLHYLWRIPQYRARAQRRILIAAAEDNLSVGVIRRVAEWYGTIERVKIEYAVREVLRICATPNWWAQDDGHAYIQAWAVAEVDVPHLEGKTEDDLFTLMAGGRAGKPDATALAAFSALYARPRIAVYRLAEVLSDAAGRSQSIQANRLASLFKANLRHIGVDANLSGQALYATLVGRFGWQGIPEPSLEEARHLIKLARDRLAGGAQVPAWALDGIHTGRLRDPRFAGTVERMAACCKAFRRFGRLSVDDRWPQNLSSGSSGPGR